MENLQIFKNAEFGSVRTITIDDEPWFVGKDVAEALGYERATKAVADHVDIEDRDEIPIQDSIGRMQNTPIINESGVYALVFSSKLPNAKKFKRWITSEVLPSIRKHGAYMTPQKIEAILNDPDTIIKLCMDLKQEREKTAVQSQQIAELQPKASYFDVVLNCKDLMSVSKIAKDYGWSAKKMNKYLHEKGVQYKQGDIWLLYRKYAEKGYTSTKTSTYNGTSGDIHTKVYTYWTQSGRLFIYDLLKSDGILPLIER